MWRLVWLNELMAFETRIHFRNRFCVCVHLMIDTAIQRIWIFCRYIKRSIVTSQSSSQSFAISLCCVLSKQNRCSQNEFIPMCCVLFPRCGEGARANWTIAWHAVRHTIHRGFNRIHRLRGAIIIHRRRKRQRRRQCFRAIYQSPIQNTWDEVIIVLLCATPSRPLFLFARRYKCENSQRTPHLEPIVTWTLRERKKSIQQSTRWTRLRGKILCQRSSETHHWNSDWNSNILCLLRAGCDDNDASETVMQQ